MTEPSAEGGAAARPRFALHHQILLATALGLAVGAALGKQAFGLGELGRLVIQLIKAAAVPLLFLSIVRAIVKTEIGGRAALRLFFFSSVNATIAIGIGLLLSNVLGLGETLARFAATENGGVAAYANKRIDLVATLSSYIPVSLVTPFAENLILSIVLIAVLLGAGLRQARREQIARGESAFRVVEDGIETLLGVMESVLGWVIRLIPFAVFGVVAKAVGEHGYGPLTGLLAYVALGIGGLALHVATTYHLWLLYAGIPLRRFWRAAKEPVIYAAGANSSLATLPVTLKALDKLGVSRSSSTLGACVGTNFNNDGIILYEGMALLFVAQAHGLHMPLTEQLGMAVMCLIAAMGVAGVPEAGFVSLALVLNTAGLPLSLLPLLLTVDWVIARGRSVVNVLSDMLLSILVDRSAAPAPSAQPSQ